ncbi:uncharacterized protein LOC141601655 [Silene latifolia]|uniref:uncharacterized protein LOC141601655 n=1 Tax=Silene latifolia TaxID=37657 RepID=UPI003D786E8E
MGDFNNVLHMDERIRSVITSAEVQDFQDCVDSYGLLDLYASGAFFTWNNNISFLPEGLYDHSPCGLDLWHDVIKPKASFHYFNIWGKSDEFLSVVAGVWSQRICGYIMFQVAKKLKLLKQPLKKLNKQNYGNIEVSANVACQLLHDLQSKIHSDPLNTALQEEERAAAKAYMELEDARRSFLAQNAKLQWMNYGDDNTHFFHCAIKARRIHNKVLQIKNAHGILCSNVVTKEQANSLIRPVTADEIRGALFSIPLDKAPGPDGYTRQFFKDAFSILGEDVIKAMQDFFTTGSLLD